MGIDGLNHTQPMVLGTCGEPEPRPGWSQPALRRFFEGGSNGEDLLHALFDHVLDEPVPVRLHAMMQRAARRRRKATARPRRLSRQRR